MYVTLSETVEEKSRDSSRFSQGVLTVRLSVPGSVRPKAKCKEKAPSAPRRPPQARAHGVYVLRPARGQSQAGQTAPRPSNTPARGRSAPTRNEPPLHGHARRQVSSRARRSRPRSAPSSSLLQGSSSPGKGGPCAPAPPRRLRAQGGHVSANCTPPAPPRTRGRVFLLPLTPKWEEVHFPVYIPRCLEASGRCVLLGKS